MNMTIERTPSEKSPTSHHDKIKSTLFSNSHSHSKVPEIRLSHKEFMGKSWISMAKTNSLGNPLAYDYTFKSYLCKIQEVTNRQLLPLPRKAIENSLNNSCFTKLPSDKSHAHGKRFHNVKKSLISE